MITQTYKNNNLEIEITSYIDKKQNIWFKGKDVAKILGYSDTDQAIRKNVSKENQITQFIQPKCSPVSQTGRKNDTRGKYFTLINESGFYELVFSSKLELAKNFRQWVFNTVLPSIRKYGQYKMFDNPCNKMIMISNEKELHYKVVNLIRNYYPDAILVAAMGENQDTEEKRLDSYKKGYRRGTPDLMILDYHKDYQGLCIEFKSPTNNYEVSESQIKMKEKYKKNNYAYILSNDYDKICKLLHKYMTGVRIPCEHCTKVFCSKKTLSIHYQIFHRIKMGGCLPPKPPC